MDTPLGVPRVRRQIANLLPATYHEAKLDFPGILPIVSPMLLCSRAPVAGLWNG